MTERGMPDERRAHKRYKVKEGVFAIRKASGWTLASVLDISRMGMGIKTPSGTNGDERYDFFDLFSCYEENVVKHVPAVVVYKHNDSECNLVTDAESSRYGVKFYGLTPNMRRVLDDFIDHHVDEK